jgi:hypothetical protein
MYKITNMTKDQTLSFEASDGKTETKSKIITGIDTYITTITNRCHVLKPGESVVSCDYPSSEPRFKVEKIEEPKNKRGV